MKGTRLGFLTISAVLLSCAAALAAQDFSADMVNTAKGKTFKGKIYFSKDKMRMDTPEAVTINRMDKKLVWILMPKDKMYMEQAFDPARAAATSEKVAGEIERKLVGQEVIDGRKTDKYMVVYTSGRKKETIYQWMAQGLALPVKTAAADNSWMVEYKNIKTGRQPDQLFEVPAGYEKFAPQRPSMKGLLKGFGR